MTSSDHRRSAKAQPPGRRGRKSPRAANADPLREATPATPSPSPAEQAAAESAADQAAEDMLEALLALDAEDAEIDDLSSALEDLLAPEAPESGPDSGTETGTETGAETDSGAETETVTGKAAPPDTTGDTGADTGAETVAETGADTAAGTGDAAGDAAGAETKPETGEETGAATGAATGAESKADRPSGRAKGSPAGSPPPPALRAEPATPARRRKKKKADLPDRPRQSAPDRARDDLDRVLRVEARSGGARGSWFRRLFWLAVLGLLIFALTRPYAMEVGGEFIIQPLDRAEVRARTDGEIVQVDVEEGDWVEAGAVLAVLSNWDEKRDVAVRQAEITRLEVELDALIEGPKPSEIAVAEQRVATAKIQLEIAATALERQEQLLEAGVISDSRVEDARANHRLAAARVAEQESSLALVSEQATPQEIASAQAEIARNLEDLRFAELKLEQTYVRATVSGQVVSTMTEVPIGTYLPEGGLFAELEDNRTVIAMIEVPETSIEDVRVDARVEMRLWSDTGTSVYGSVKRLAPRAEERDFGRVVRVHVEVPNPDGKLNANMTGQAKIDAGVFPAWVVFTRLIVRFFDVEVWSWVP
ncbi:HlyD family secretion protein [Shimia sp.]|uniref:HlyD family secretion protein n=1 Tax=Shimia sp. TaxID=1954381 RepID=UPI0035646BF9